jgi:DNA-binding response OmpR family regulator
VTANRILIIDDSEVVRSLVIKGLSAAGYAVTAAGTYEEMTKALQQSFDLILMDLNMPELYGDDVGNVLRYVRGVKTPIYMLSSADTSELETRSKDAGLDGWISKRDGMRVVFERIKQLLPLEQRGVDKKA